jgi:hypothetical protein
MLSYLYIGLYVKCPLFLSDFDETFLGRCVVSDFSREVEENCALLCYYAASSGNFLPTFRDNLLVLSCPLKIEPIGGPEHPSVVTTTRCVITQRSAVVFFLDRFSRIIGIKLYEIRPVGGRLFHADSQTDRRTERLTKTRSRFSQCSERV